jgi:hypothetical protein
MYRYVTYCGNLERWHSYYVTQTSRLDSSRFCGVWELLCTLKLLILAIFFLSDVATELETHEATENAIQMFVFSVSIRLCRKQFSDTV